MNREITSVDPVSCPGTPTYLQSQGSVFAVWIRRTQLAASIASMCALSMGILGVGCQMPEPVAKPPTAESKSSPETVAKETPPPNPDADVKPPKTGDNPYRLYQLRDLTKATVSIGGHPFRLWSMDTPEKDREGMMWLADKDVKADEGMIFPSETPTNQTFWMQNTLIPLDLVFVSAGKKVLNIAHGKPLDEKTQLVGKGPAMYVIELKDGTGKRLGIAPGAKVDIPSSVKRVP